MNFTGIPRFLGPVNTRWFELFDGALPNDEPAWTAPHPSAVPTAIPDHRTLWQSGWIIVESEGLTYRSKPSAMELLAGWLFGVARKRPGSERISIRVLPRASDLVVSKEGDSPLWQETLDLAFLLHRLGERDEARFLLRRVLRSSTLPDRSGDPATEPEARAHKLLGPLVAELPHEVRARGSTTQAAMKWMLETSLHCSSDPLVRRDVAEEMHDIVSSTTVAVSRLATVASPVTALLDDAEPGVVAKAATSCDYLVSKLFNHKDYDVALGLAEALEQRGFNADIQAARVWECLAAMAREEEAEAAWSRAVGYGAAAGRAPRQHAGLHTDYPSLDFWRVFAELRVAVSQMWIAAGEHPSEEMRKKKKRIAGADLTPEQWKQRASRWVQSATAKMSAWIESEPAQLLGPMVAEFAEEYARATGHGRIDGKGFVMHSQYVSFRRFGSPFQCAGHKIEAAGEFEETGPRRFRFHHATTGVEATLGRAFGIEYRFLGRPAGRLLPARVRVTRPTPDGITRQDDYPTMVNLGLRENFVWKFESNDEIAAGPWQIEVSLFSADAPTDYPFRGTLAPKDLLGSLQQDFIVVVR